jgi:hypothetical protein
LNLAVNLLSRHNRSKVAWIDTTGDFSVEALNDILSEKQVDFAFLPFILFYSVDLSTI